MYCVCMSFLYLPVFVCIVCICMYFLHEKLLVASIQTHSARYMQNKQNTYKIHFKYNSNTDKYMQIQAFTYTISFFSRPAFRVCMWPVFVCIVCILLYDVAGYMSHTIELVCVCMCLYCLYVYVFFGMYFAPNVQVRFLGREKLLSVLIVCIVCISLYWMNWWCICLYCSGTHNNHRHVP